MNIGRLANSAACVIRSKHLKPTNAGSRALSPRLLKQSTRGPDAKPLQPPIQFLRQAPPLWRLRLGQVWSPRVLGSRRIPPSHSRHGQRPRLPQDLRDEDLPTERGPSGVPNPP